MSKGFIISSTIALTYWILACIVLADIINGTGMIFPGWLSMILTPGFILGFIFGYGGGTLWAIIGQIVILPIFILIARDINNRISKRKHNNT